MFKICRSNCLDLDAYKSLSLSAALSLSFSLNLFRKLKTQKESFHQKMYCFPSLTSQNCRYINFLQYSSCFASKLKRFARAGFYRVRSAACRSHSAKAAEGQIRSKRRIFRIFTRFKIFAVKKLKRFARAVFRRVRSALSSHLSNAARGQIRSKRKSLELFSSQTFQGGGGSKISLDLSRRIKKQYLSLYQNAIKCPPSFVKFVFTKHIVLVGCFPYCKSNIWLWVYAP